MNVLIIFCKDGWTVKLVYFCMLCVHYFLSKIFSKKKYDSDNHIAFALIY